MMLDPPGVGLCAGDDQEIPALFAFGLDVRGLLSASCLRVVAALLVRLQGMPANPYHVTSPMFG